MKSGRWVSYIYRYREGRRCENAGFVKVQRIGCEEKAQARIQIGIKLYKNKMCRCVAYLIYHQKKIGYLTDFCIQPNERDTIIKRVEISWDNPLADGRHIHEYDGVLFICDDGEMLAGTWADFEFVPDNIEIPQIVVGKDERQEKISTKYQKGNEDKYQTMSHMETETEMIEEAYTETDTDMVCEPQRNNQADVETQSYVHNQSDNDESDMNDESDLDYCQQMLATHPKLPVFMDSQLIECVKIVPHDIGKLPMANWKLGVNSFLSHGYYHYRYIMMGRVNFDDREVYVIGVPGVFTNKEKYLANMFGFNVFVPVKHTEILTGNFGYWISEIVSV